VSFWPVAKLTFKESVKERFFIGMLLVEVLLLFLSYYLSELAAGDSVKVGMDFALVFYFFLTALFAVMVPVSTLFRDISDKFVYLILSKPIKRESYLAGKYFGSLMALALFLFASFFIVSVGVLGISHFARLYVPHVIVVERIFLLTLSLFLMGALLSAFSTFFSILFTSQTLATVVGFLLFLSGLELASVKELALSSDYVSPFNKLLIKVLYYFFPNFSLYDLKAYAVHLQLSVSSLYFALIVLYTLLYSCAVLLISTWLFNRREL